MPKAPKTHNSNTLTEAAYFTAIRSVLRRGFRYWKPLKAAELAARSKYTGSNKLRKWSYQCNTCKQLFKRTEVNVDHTIPVGTLKALSDLPAFVERLTAESGYEVMCKGCHQVKTAMEKSAREKKN